MINKPCIVEMVGPPGSGKTTLARTMLERNNNVHLETFPYFRRIEQIPFFASNFLLLLPTLLHLNKHMGDEGVILRDLALITILKGWPRVLIKKRTSKGTVIILEEGAVCLLARLYGFGSMMIRDESAQKWWDSTYKQWAQTLDFVIRLDTPDPILLQRIRQRERQYEIEKLRDDDAMRYLNQIRMDQDHVLTRLTAKSVAPKQISINTADKTIDQIYAELVCSELNP